MRHVDLQDNLPGPFFRTFKRKGGLRRLVSAVIFDMDGLMFDTESLNMRGWVEAGRRHGYEMTEEVIYGHIGANLAVTRRLMTEHFGPGFETTDRKSDRLLRSRIPKRNRIRRQQRFLAAMRRHKAKGRVGRRQQNQVAAVGRLFERGRQAGDMVAAANDATTDRKSVV